MSEVQTTAMILQAEGRLPSHDRSDTFQIVGNTLGEGVETYFLRNGDDVWYSVLAIATASNQFKPEGKLTVRRRQRDGKNEDIIYVLPSTEPGTFGHLRLVQKE